MIDARQAFDAAALEMKLEFKIEGVRREDGLTSAQIEEEQRLAALKEASDGVQ